MSSRIFTIAVGVLVLAVIVVYLFSFQVRQTETAVKLTFGGSKVAQEEFALREAEDGSARALREQQPVELLPQNPYLRRLQHEIIGKHKLESRSVGKDPRRRVRILPKQVEA